MKTWRYAAGCVTVLAVVGSMAASTASAAPGSGTTPANVVQGTLAGPERARQDGVTLRTREDTTVRTFELTYAVGGFSGWHAHPGIVIAVVKSGTVVRQVGCRKETFTVGQSFTEVEPHFVSNASTDAAQPGAVPAVLSITQIFPKGEPVREETDPPVCPGPRT